LVLLCTSSSVVARTLLNPNLVGLGFVDFVVRCGGESRLGRIGCCCCRRRCRRGRPGFVTFLPRRRLQRPSLQPERPLVTHKGGIVFAILKERMARLIQCFDGQGNFSPGDIVPNLAGVFLEGTERFLDVWVGFLGDEWGRGFGGAGGGVLDGYAG
jgi:hypothetical protein